MRNKGRNILIITVLGIFITSNLAFASGEGRASIVRHDKNQNTTKVEIEKKSEIKKEELKKIQKQSNVKEEKSKPIEKDLSKTEFRQQVKIKKSLYAPIVPAKGIKISSAYGSRIHPISKKRTTHWGIDIAAPIGTLIHAISDGEIIMAKPNGKAGNEVKIKHSNGVETRYLHMSKRAITVGDKVSAGQVIGTVGSTGSSTGPHLHFEVKVDGKNIDPSEIFNK